MNSSQPFDRSHHNPFATRFVRPGAIPFRFPHQASVHTLVKKLQSHKWRGEIVGPHGVGKSSLLATLLPEIATLGREIIHVTLHDGQRNLPRETPPWASWGQNTLLVIDGYEQLSRWSRVKLAWQCWWSGTGLLITTHRTFGFPTILAPSPQLATAIALVRELGVTEAQIQGTEIENAFQICHGNMREMLFCLYDLYERKLRE